MATQHEGGFPERNGIEAATTPKPDKLLALVAASEAVCAERDTLRAEVQALREEVYLANGRYDVERGRVEHLTSTATRRKDRIIELESKLATLEREREGERRDAEQRAVGRVLKMLATHSFAEQWGMVWIDAVQDACRNYLAALPHADKGAE